MEATGRRGQTVPEGIEVFPKKAHVHRYLAGAVGGTQLLHPLTDKDKRYPLPAIALQVVQRAADRGEKGRQKQVVGDQGGG